MFPETLIAMTRIADMKRDCPIDEPSVRGDSAAARSAARDGHPRRPGRPDRCRGQRIGRAATA
jgi:hypothetical protein